MLAICAVNCVFIQHYPSGKGSRSRVLTLSRAATHRQALSICGRREVALSQLPDVSTLHRAALRPKPNTLVFSALPSTGLLDQLRTPIRLLHHSRRTEGACAHCCGAVIRFHDNFSGQSAPFSAASVA
jgi:hypothetical protein